MTEKLWKQKVNQLLGGWEMEEPDRLSAPKSPVEPELGSRRGWVKSCHAGVCGGEAAEAGSRWMMQGCCSMLMPMLNRG